MSTETAPLPDLRPTDFLAIDTLLSRRGARHPRHASAPFVRDRVVPNVGDWFEEARDPARARDGARPARRARHAPRGLRLRRRERDRLRARVPGARGRRQRRAQPRLRPGLAGHVRDPPLGLGGAEAGVAAADGRRRGDRLLRPDRARLRLRPRLDAHPRPARRRRLDPPRAEDVDHQRLDRRRRGRVGAHRRRRPRLPRARRTPRASRTQDIHRKLSLRASVTLRAAARRRPPARASAMLPEATGAARARSRA